MTLKVAVPSEPVTNDVMGFPFESTMPAVEEEGDIESVTVFPGTGLFPEVRSVTVTDWEPATEAVALPAVTVDTLGETMSVDNRPSAPGLLDRVKDLFN